MTEIEKELRSLADTEYADFHGKLIPTVPRELILGVRVPVLRNYAKQLLKIGAEKEFLGILPHCYYDENMLHSLLLNEIKTAKEAFSAVNDFLPYIDNWAVCDILFPKVLLENKPELLRNIYAWMQSESAFTCRFGILMLMRGFLDEDFKPSYADAVCKVRRDDYYVKMMIAWYFSTALAKNWDDIIPYLENNRLEPWVHNKTVQKARESYRITSEQKAYLKKLKV